MHKSLAGRLSACRDQTQTGTMGVSVFFLFFPPPPPPPLFFLMWHMVARRQLALF